MDTHTHNKSKVMDEYKNSVVLIRGWEEAELHSYMDLPKILKVAVTDMQTFFNLFIHRKEKKISMKQELTYRPPPPPLMMDVSKHSNYRLSTKCQKMNWPENQIMLINVPPKSFFKASGHCAN